MYKQHSLEGKVVRRIRKCLLEKIKIVRTSRSRVNEDREKGASAKNTSSSGRRASGAGLWEFSRPDAGNKLCVLW